MHDKLEKIVFVIEQLSSGGAERVTAALASSFSIQKNFEVHIIVLNKKIKYLFSPHLERGAEFFR